MTSCLHHQPELHLQSIAVMLHNRAVEGCQLHLQSIAVMLNDSTGMALTDLWCAALPWVFP